MKTGFLYPGGGIFSVVLIPFPSMTGRVPSQNVLTGRFNNNTGRDTMKKERLTRVAAFLLTVMTAAAVIACAEDTAGTPDSCTGTADASGDTTDAAETQILADVPEMDYGGYTFTFMHYESDTGNSLQNKDLFAEKITGDALNDSVYERNSLIEKEYNIKIALRLEMWNTMPAKMKKLVQAGDADIDVFYPFGYTVSELFTSGIFYNLKDIPYIDFSKPWWDTNAVNDLAISGNLYFVTTNINILDKTATSIMIFNKKMAENYNCPDFYELVNGNRWTIDTLGEVSKGVTADINGDSVMDVNDIYGLVGADTFIVALFHSLGGNYTLPDENEYPVSNITCKKTSDIFDKIFGIIYDGTVYQHIDWLGYPLAPEAVELFFTGGHSLLSWTILESLDRLRATEVDFGILPLPKYDENQKNYYHFVSKYGTSFLRIPKSADDIERTGIILEALAAKSQYTVLPTYYDIVLKGKYTRDDDSEDMLDIIINSRIYSLADIAGIGTVGDVVLRCVSKNKGTPPAMTSSFTGLESAFQNAIDKFISKMSE